MITGAASGIGKGIALKFASEGKNLFLLDINEDNLLTLKSEIEEKYPAIHVIYATGDLTSNEFVEKVINQIREESNEIQVLVNNAGIFPSTPFLQISRKEWESVFDLNVTSLFFLTQEVSRLMIDSKTKSANIVNITSAASVNARPGVAHYCSSKAAVKMLTQVLALELAPFDIRVNAVGPGLVETETLQKTLTNEQAIAEHEEKISYSPMNRTAKIEEIASSVYFIASSDASYITGHSLLVDGGYSAGRVFKTFNK